MTRRRTNWRREALAYLAARDALQRAWHDQFSTSAVLLLERDVWRWLALALLEERAATDERRQAA